jgi:hypothetical protein
MAIGFYGGWIACHALSRPDLASLYTVCAIGHPSCHLESLFGGDPQELFDALEVPILLLPANNDPLKYHETGSWFQSVKSRYPASQSIVFSEVECGFIPRGDITILEKKLAVEKALKLFVDFFQTHLS